MTGKALLWLKEGLSVEVITDRLTKEYLHPPVTKAPSLKKLPPRPVSRKIYDRFKVSTCFANDMVSTSERVKDCAIGIAYLERRLAVLRPSYYG